MSSPTVQPDSEGLKAIATLAQIGGVGLLVLAPLDLIWVLRGSPSGPLPSMGLWGVAALATAGALGVIVGSGLRSRSRWAWWGAIVLVILSFGISAACLAALGSDDTAPETDDAGMAGASLIMVMLVQVALLIVLSLPSVRRALLPRSPGEDPGPSLGVG